MPERIFYMRSPLAPPGGAACIDSNLGHKAALHYIQATRLCHLHCHNASECPMSMTQNTFGQNSIWKSILWIEASLRLSIKTWTKKIVSPWTTWWERRPSPRRRTRRRGGWLRGCARTRGSKGCCSVSNRSGPDNLKPSFSHPSVLTNLESCYFALFAGKFLTELLIFKSPTNLYTQFWTPHFFTK